MKRFEVKPGAQLSMQKHFHRAEHWVVVKGVAKVILENKESLLEKNQSIFIPLGCKHRLSNPGKLKLVLIEVQKEIIWARMILFVFKMIMKIVK